MRESFIMRVHYGTAAAAVALVAVHVLFRVTRDFHESLEYDAVVANYEYLPYAGLLGAILVLLSVHGFNGLRVILIELRQGRRYERAVSYGCAAAALAVVAYGMRTIVLVASGAHRWPRRGAAAPGPGWSRCA